MKREDKSTLEISLEFIEVPEHDKFLNVQLTYLRTNDIFETMSKSIALKASNCKTWKVEEVIYKTYEICYLKLVNEWGTLAMSTKYVS